MGTDQLVAVAFGILITLWIQGDLSSVHSTNVLEIKCKANDLFDAEKRCNNFSSVGATFKITVNTSTQQVLFDVTKTDGNWSNGAFLLDSCRVVDASNWECIRTDHINNVLLKADYVLRVGMTKGQFYRSYTGGDGPDFYSSGLSGWRYWAVYLGILSSGQAIKI